MILPAWNLLLLFATSLALTRFMVFLANRFQLIDRPNDRSSHAVDTPRSGGVGFVVILTLSLMYLDGSLLVLTLCALVIATLGLMDDILTIPPLPRFAVQLIMAVVFIAFLPQPDIPAVSWLFLSILCVPGLIWATNLYNFMDGIDGLAGIQALLLAGGLAFMTLVDVYPGVLGWVGLILISTVSGFLVFNLPPARIFMGDTGSAYLGFLLAGLMLKEYTTDSDVIWLWLILLAVFICDATTTLVVRIARGEPFYQAHRTHLYQLIAQEKQQRLITSGMASERARARSHRFYLNCFCGAFFMLQLPVACLVALGWITGWLGTLVVFSALMSFHFWAGSGQPKLKHRLF